MDTRLDFLKAQQLVEDSGGSAERALFLACGSGFSEIAAILIRKMGVDVGSKAHRGETALHIAAARGEAATARMLVEGFGANVHAKSDSGDTPLHLAAGNGTTLKWSEYWRGISALTLRL